MPAVLVLERIYFGFTSAVLKQLRTISVKDQYMCMVGSGGENILLNTF